VNLASASRAHEGIRRWHTGHGAHRAQGARVPVREIDKVRVKGKQRRGNLRANRRQAEVGQEMLRTSTASTRRSRPTVRSAGRREKLLKNLAYATPETKLYKLYLERIAHFRTSPPPADWTACSSSPPSDPSAPRRGAPAMTTRPRSAIPSPTPSPPGEALAVAPGVWWIRMPLPFALDHINLCCSRTATAGRRRHRSRRRSDLELWRGPRRTDGRQAVKRIVVTHYHPTTWGGRVARGTHRCAGVDDTSEFLSAHAARDDAADSTEPRASPSSAATDSTCPPFREAAHGEFLPPRLPELPRHYRRLMHGDTLTIDGHDWRVICVFGHAPEHARSTAPRWAC